MDQNYTGTLADELQNFLKKNVLNASSYKINLAVYFEQLYMCCTILFVLKIDN